MKYCSINGMQQTEIAVTDRGLAYGDGLFTTAKVIDGQVILLDKHVNRLIEGCEHLGIASPTRNYLAEQMKRAATGFILACIKVVITTGSGGRGYSRGGLSENAMQVIVMVNDFPTNYHTLRETGISLGNSKKIISSSPMLAGIKHLNRLEQVLLRAELDASLVDDLVVTNEQSLVIETTCANIFFWRDEQLFTPDLMSSGVNGIIRQEILKYLPSTRVVKTSMEDLHLAQEVFICNSLMGIMPVNTYNEHQLKRINTLKLQVQLYDVI